MLLTDAPGASVGYVGGVISYATRLKDTLAGVSPATLQAVGPVAEQTAAEMAEGVCRRCQADWGMATTGVAGPEPQDGHPVGEVFVAVAHPAYGLLRVKALSLTGDRVTIRSRQRPHRRSSCSPRPWGLPRRPVTAIRSGNHERGPLWCCRWAGYSLLMRSEVPVRPTLLRELIGESLREERVAQGRTLREVSKAAQVSLGYLSEVERGQKEASSELLAAMCAALDLPLVGGAQPGQREAGADRDRCATSGSPRCRACGRMAQAAA